MASHHRRGHKPQRSNQAGLHHGFWSTRPAPITVEGLAQMVATDFRRLLTSSCMPRMGVPGDDPAAGTPDLDPPSRFRRWCDQAVEAGVALREEGQNPRVGWRRPLRECGSPPADNVEVPVGMVVYPQVRDGGEHPTAGSSRVGGCWVRGLGGKVGFSAGLGVFGGLMGCVRCCGVPVMGVGGVG